MIKIKIILFFFILSLPLNAEIVTESGKHKHLGDKTKNESCKIAEGRAQKNAIIKSLGRTVSSEVISNCSEVDGEYDCERNQLSLLELNGDITESRIINRKYDKELGTEILFCEITIKANVEPVKKNTDPTFQFDVKLNQKIFRTGETVKLEINTSKEMYISIFQWLPYGGTKYNIVTKIFPNKTFSNDIDNLVNGKKELKYRAYFPEEINKNKVDEYFIYVASEENINWLPEYAEIEGLKKQFLKNNTLMEKHISGYILIR